MLLLLLLFGSPRLIFFTSSIRSVVGRTRCDSAGVATRVSASIDETAAQKAKAREALIGSAGMAKLVELVTKDDKEVSKPWPLLVGVLSVEDIVDSPSSSSGCRARLDTPTALGRSISCSPAPPNEHTLRAA